MTDDGMDRRARSRVKFDAMHDPTAQTVTFVRKQDGQLVPLKMTVPYAFLLKVTGSVMIAMSTQMKQDNESEAFETMARTYDPPKFGGKS